jgi:hypothetical protein
MTINVRVKSQSQKVKATVASGVIMARTLNELLDDDSNSKLRFSARIIIEA